MSNLIEELKAKTGQNDFTETTSINQNLFINETESHDKNGHPICLTKMTSDIPPQRHFKISNPNENLITHICIDGDFIPFGQAKYNIESQALKDGRPDCIVFDISKFIFVELKLEQEDASFDKEKTKWKRFFSGVKQIEDFVAFLQEKGFDIEEYYPASEIFALICMRFEPNFRRNTRRNTEILRRSNQLGFRILAQNHNTAFEF